MRILLYILLGYLAYRLFSSLLLPQKRTNPKKKFKQSADAEEMIACARCGTYVAKAQAVTKNGQTFCSLKCSL